jgi:deoxyribose-phosphate aldolase
LSTSTASNHEDLRGLLEYNLIRPELTEESVARRCEIAKQHGVAAVIVRPSDVDLAVRWIAGSSVRLATLAGSWHGYSSTAVKTYETRDLLRRGAQEIDTVMNTGKLLSRQFQYLETELLQIAESCHQSGALLKVNLESEFLNEELNIVACRIARRAGADYIGTNKLQDMPLLLTHARERLKIKCSTPVADLETALAFREAGCARIEVADPVAILAAGPPVRS